MKPFFFVLNGKQLKRMLLIGAIALFAVGIIYSESQSISVFSPRQPAAIYSVQTDKKWIALTFDISWGEHRTLPILKVLENKKVKNATFFLSSPWVKSHPNIVKEIVKSGFEIGSHGHRHLNYSTLNEDEIRREIVTARNIIKEETGITTHLIRMPNGDFDKRVLRIADELNYKVIQWDTDSLDWMNKGVDQIVNRVIKKAHPGDIVLLHASDSCKQTHLALPTIIDKLRADGYSFVTVTQLLNQVSIDQSTIQ
jgi:polysaccharide deacetylase family sporulation protein PdaB